MCLGFFGDDLCVFWRGAGLVLSVRVNSPTSRHPTGNVPSILRLERNANISHSKLGKRSQYSRGQTSPVCWSLRYVSRDPAQNSNAMWTVPTHGEHRSTVLRYQNTLHTHPLSLSLENEPRHQCSSNCKGALNSQKRLGILESAPGYSCGARVRAVGAAAAWSGLRG